MMQTRLGTKQDITGILSLQERNLFSNLNEQEHKYITEKGFNKDASLAQIVNTRETTLILR